MVTIMKKIAVDGYKGFVSTLRVEEGANGCPYLLGDQDWDYRVRADIYIGSNRELTKLWQIFRVCSDYYLQYEVPNFNKDTKYCIVVEFKNQFGDRVPVPRVCRMDQFCWDYYLDVTPDMAAYGDLKLVEKLYKIKLAEWEKNNTWF